LTHAQRTITHRSRLGPVQALVATSVIVGVSLFFTPGLLLVAAFAVLWVTFGSAITMLRLKGHTVQLDGDLLRQLDAQGRERGEIDLGRSFTYEFLYREEGNAIYRLRQGTSSIDFSSDLPEAEHLVKDVMKLEWPPPMNTVCRRTWA